jgi:hypothetical protein
LSESIASIRTWTYAHMDDIAGARAEFDARST